MWGVGGGVRNPSMQYNVLVHGCMVGRTDKRRCIWLNVHTKGGVWVAERQQKQHAKVIMHHPLKPTPSQQPVNTQSTHQSQQSICVKHKVIRLCGAVPYNGVHPPDLEIRGDDFQIVVNTLELRLLKFQSDVFRDEIDCYIIVHPVCLYSGNGGGVCGSRRKRRRRRRRKMIIIMMIIIILIIIIMMMIIMMMYEM